MNQREIQAPGLQQTTISREDCTAEFVADYPVGERFTYTLDTIKLMSEHHPKVSMGAVGMFALRGAFSRPHDVCSSSK